MMPKSSDRNSAPDQPYAHKDHGAAVSDPAFSAGRIIRRTQPFGLNHFEIGTSACVCSPNDHPSRSGGATPNEVSILDICSRCSAAWMIVWIITTQGSTMYPSKVLSIGYPSISGTLLASASSASPLEAAASRRSENAGDGLCLDSTGRVRSER